MTMVVREEIPEVFRCIKTAMIKMFGERYDAITKAIATQSMELFLLQDYMGEERCSSGLMQHKAPGVRHGQGPNCFYEVAI